MSPPGASSLVTVDHGKGEEPPQKKPVSGQDQETKAAAGKKRRKDHKKLDRQRKAAKAAEREAQQKQLAEEQGGGQELAEEAPAAEEEGGKKSKGKKRPRKDGSGHGEDNAGETAEEQAEWLWKMYRHHGGDSFLEREAFTGEAVVAIPVAGGSFEDCMKSGMKDWKAKFCGVGKFGPGKEGAKGAPVVLVLTSGGQRAADLIREMPEAHRACKVAKLFAKHLKVEQQMEMLRQHVQVAVGTPNRIKKLIDLGALNLTNLKLVVLDLWRDVKKYHLLTLKEVQADLWSVFSAHFFALAAQGKLKIALHRPSADAADSGGGGAGAEKFAKKKAKGATREERSAKWGGGGDGDVEELDDNVFSADYDGY